MSVSSYLLKACKKCGGDLAPDYGDWVCLQCGAYYYVGLYRRREVAGDFRRRRPGRTGKRSGRERIGPGLNRIGRRKRRRPADSGWFIRRRGR